ncbi:LolA family protein [Imtechella halotolerans]|uniref:Outer membrane lipoprotein carrier protein lola n=1 Tax=Imtechella halotolerans K1 TaxID=946077 RepID=I0WCC3_9FLAO|nr:outer membrane lipoprotein carrier protein LolA [Imtechella halotolerans]EID74039.1 outer membrane lipoprotein carrier protein lola [Imtechella halotolerans K1]WMQ64566.1 outer membrane lipoprotein carrier protein LolA [Imtechella halotolerans]
MKKMIAALAVLFSITLSAQNDAKAKALLDEVYTKVNGYENIYVDFKYVLENTKENIKQETKGNVTLQKNKYLFNYLGATKMFDGKKTYTVVPENEEVIIETSNGDDEGTITPSKMLTFYKQGYKYKWDIAQNVKGRQIQYVELIPISSNSDIKQILLGIDVQTKHIYNLIETGKNGTKTTITVNSFKTNQPLSKSLFTFDEGKYKKEGYYISKN